MNAIETRTAANGWCSSSVGISETRADGEHNSRWIYRKYREGQRSPTREPISVYGRDETLGSITTWWANPVDEAGPVKTTRGAPSIRPAHLYTDQSTKPRFCHRHQGRRTCWRPTRRAATIVCSAAAGAAKTVLIMELITTRQGARPAIRVRPAGRSAPARQRSLHEMIEFQGKSSIPRRNNGSTKGSEVRAGVWPDERAAGRPRPLGLPASRLAEHFRDQGQE